MNSKAKQRAASTGIGRAQDDTLPVEPAVHGSAAPVRAVEDGAGPTGPHVFSVADGEEGKRLDRFLADRFGSASGLSRTRLQSLITAGAVQVDGKPAGSANMRLDPTANVSLDIPRPVPAEPSAEAIPLAIVYEDDHLLVIDKPAGLVVHPAAGHESGTLVNALIAH